MFTLNHEVEEFRQHISRWVDERLAPRAEDLDRIRVILHIRRERRSWHKL